MATVEKSRPLVDQTSSLNSTRSQKSSDSKSSALELLSITDAAVSALSKTRENTTSVYASNQGSFSMFQDGIRLLSPMEMGPSPTDNFQSPVSPDCHELSGRSSHGSRSTTASEVLINSTVRDIDVHVPFSHNESHVSKISDTSQASSTFLTGQAKPVKVSSKKLKEIHSPFDDSDTQKGTDEQMNKVNSAKKPSKLSAKAQKVSSRKLEKLESENSTTEVKRRLKAPPLQTKKQQATVKQTFPRSDPHIDEKISKQTEQCAFPQSEPHVEDAILMHTEQQTFPRSDPQAGDDVLSDKENLLSTMAESGYMTQSVKGVKDGPLPLIENVHDKSTPRDPSSTTEDIFGGTDSHSPIDVFAKDDVSSNSSQPEIFTVPETIVTVRGTDVNRSDGSGSFSSLSTVEPTNAATTLENRFSRFQTSGLRQGTLGDASYSGQVSNTSQVHIAKISMTEKQKQLRSAFGKRNTGTQAVKKHVKPTVVQHEMNPSTDPRLPNQQSVNDAATTAAVAAASAVAATQPFLRAQQDLEQRIAQLMDKVGSVQNQPSQLSENSSNKVDVLERQLNDLTQHRLQYLEDMQKQQMQWQAQLLNIPRAGCVGKEVSPSSEYGKYHFQPDPRNKAITKTVLSDDELGLHQYMKKGNIQEKEKSVLDTPAPRAKPPTPTILDDMQKSEINGHLAGQVTPDQQHKVPGGLLAQILSQDGETPQHSRFLETPQKRYDEVSQKAGELVQELGDLKTQIRKAIANVPRTPRSVTPVLDQTISMYEGPAPLDQYMNKIVHPATSPYPKLRELNSQANAPVISHFSDIQDVLKKVTLSRTYLEANLDSIVRNRQETDIYSLLESITWDSSQTERVRVRKMVDKHINAMNSNMEREVLDELLKVEEAKKNMTNFMIPERDTTGIIDRSKVKVTGPRSRLRAESRIDTGLNKKRDGVKDGGMKIREKEYVPQKKFKKYKGLTAKDLENEELKSHIYGKAAYVPQRKTQKEPYLRFRSTSPKPSSPKAVGRPVETKGILVSGARSQAGDGYISPTAILQHQQIPAQPSPPALIPMAIPLGAPRKDGGLTAPISFPSHPSQPFTSTPCGQIAISPANVGIFTKKDKALENEEREMRELAKKKKEIKLETRTMPSVDIDPYETPHMSPRSTIRSPKCAESRKNVEFHKVEAEEMQKVEENSESESEEEEDTITEDADSAGIDLPGLKAPPAQAYHGPQFPPQAVHITQAPPTSDVLANDIRRKDILQNQAIDWVEQELMARVISEVYAKRRDTVPHTPVTIKPTRHVEDDEETQSEVSEVSSHDSFIAETLGHDGFQLFVDAGQPVDDKLVNALLKEVILEKISLVVGQRTSQDDEEMKHVSVAIKPKPGPSQSLSKQPTRTIDSPVEIPDTPVVTPVATPQHTPPHAASPVHLGTPPVTPDRMPSPSIVKRTDPVIPVVASESEDSVKDDSEEIRFNRIIEGHPITPLTRIGESPGPPHYEVCTPDTTPPPTPPSEVEQIRTPSPSLRTASPEPIHETPSPKAPEQVDEKPASPQPWTNPESPIPEEIPPDEEVIVEKPMTFSVATQADEEQPARLHSPPPRSPKLQPRRLSASSEESPASASSSISDTVNEKLSEGQWLLTLRSEGEVPGEHVGQGFHDRIRQLLVGGKPTKGHHQDDSQADDTLLETEELEPDQDGYSQSEGEFVHTATVLNDRYAALTALAQMKSSGPNWAAQKPIIPTELAAGVDVSLGEVSFGQRPRLTTVQERSMFSQSQGRRVLNGNNGRTAKLSSEEHESLGEISESPELEVQNPGTKPITVQPCSSPASSSLARSLTRPVTVTAGGREPSRHYKPISSMGARPRVIQVSRSLSPEPTGTRAPTKPADTGASQTSLFGASDLETQTTDQMNVEAILQSQDYLANTQSDLGSTAPDMDIGQSDKFMYSLTRSEEFYQHSGLMRQSIGSTSDMSLAPGLTKTLERSEEELVQDSRQSCSAESDLRMSGQLAIGPRTMAGTRTGPLQVSVTIPSVGEEDSQESYEDVSEFSFV